MENGESFAGWRASCASESAIAVHFWMRITIDKNPKSGFKDNRLICLSLLNQRGINSGEPVGSSGGRGDKRVKLALHRNDGKNRNSTRVKTRSALAIGQVH